MHRYQFRISEGTSSEVDREEMEFPSQAAAHADALRFAGRVLRDRSGRSDPEGVWRVEVVDETGATLFRIEVTVETVPSRQLSRRA